MAPRWKLAQPHYLNSPGTEWEYQEQVQGPKGKMLRHRYPVPLYLDPRDPADHNFPGNANQDGMIIVTNVDPAKDGNPMDIQFLGDPTPDMVPLNDEAQKISDSFASKWQHPIDGLPANGQMLGNFSQSLLAGLEKQLAAALQQQQAAPAQPVSVKNVPNDRLEQLEKAVAALQARNAELEALHEESSPPLPSKTKPATAETRRI